MSATIKVLGAPLNAFGTSARSGSSLITVVRTSASVNPYPEPNPNTALARICTP